MGPKWFIEQIGARLTPRNREASKSPKRTEAFTVADTRLLGLALARHTRERAVGAVSPEALTELSDAYHDLISIWPKVEWDESHRGYRVEVNALLNDAAKILGPAGLLKE